MVDYFTDVLVDIVLNFPIESKQNWFSVALNRIPDDVLTTEEKFNMLKIIGYVEDGSMFSSRKAYETRVRDDFELMAKRTRNSIMRGN